jgi:hypothetical protein
MRLLKQSTAIILRAGPFVNVADGYTYSAGLTIAQADIQLSKAGGAFAQTSAATPTTTYDSKGHYQVPLTTTDTGTLGLLRVMLDKTPTSLPVWEDFMVVPANVFEALVNGTEFLEVTGLRANFSIAATTLTVKKPDGTTTQFTKSLTPTPGASPITGIS